jgi:hypothetical protein
MGEVRRYFEAYEAVDTIGFLIDRAEDVASVADIRRYQLFVDAGRRVPLCVRAHDALIARRARCDCLLEESRIRGDAAEAFFTKLRRCGSSDAKRLALDVQLLLDIAGPFWQFQFICQVEIATALDQRINTFASGPDWRQRAFTARLRRIVMFRNSSSIAGWT